MLMWAGVAVAGESEVELKREKKRVDFQGKIAIPFCHQTIL